MSIYVMHDSSVLLGERRVLFKWINQIKQKWPSLEPVRRKHGVFKSQLYTNSNLSRFRVFHKWHLNDKMNLCVYKVVKNIVRHIACAIVSLPNYSDLIMIRQSKHSHRTRELGELEPHSPIYLTKDYWDNWLDLRHTLARIYLTSIWEVQCR